MYFCIDCIFSKINFSSIRNANVLIIPVEPIVTNVAHYLINVNGDRDRLETQGSVFHVTAMVMHQAVITKKVSIRQDSAWMLMEIGKVAEFVIIVR